MARRFAKVSEEEFVAINEKALFYPSDVVNILKQLSPSGLVKSGGYISTSPSGDSCIIVYVYSLYIYIYIYIIYIYIYTS